MRSIVKMNSSSPTPNPKGCGRRSRGNSRSRRINAPRLGQHFLRSEKGLAAIVESARLGPGDVVLEIGPGEGALTRAIAKRAGRVVAVERDLDLARALTRALQSEGVRNVRVITEDIRNVEPGELGLGPHYSVVANIPYYLTSRLIRDLLEAEHPPESMVLTVQREVAERIVAAPPAANLLGLACQAYSQPKIIAYLPAEAFRPRPKVASAVVSFRNISRRFFEARRIAADEFFAVARLAFGQRRKTLANSLAGVFGGKPFGIRALTACRIAEAARPQELHRDDWVCLAKHVPANPSR